MLYLTHDVFPQENWASSPHCTLAKHSLGLLKAWASKGVLLVSQEKISCLLKVLEKRMKHKTNKQTKIPTYLHLLKLNAQFQLPQWVITVSYSCTQDEPTAYESWYTWHKLQCHYQYTIKIIQCFTQIYVPIYKYS